MHRGPARARPGLKLEAPRAWGVAPYGDLAHAVQTLSSAGLERRDTPASCPTPAPPHPPEALRPPPRATGRPSGGAGPHHPPPRPPRLPRHHSAPAPAP